MNCSFTHKQGYIPRARHSANETRQVHITLYHLYKIQKQAKVLMVLEVRITTYFF